MGGGEVGVGRKWEREWLGERGIKKRDRVGGWESRRGRRRRERVGGGESGREREWMREVVGGGKE